MAVATATRTRSKTTTATVSVTALEAVAQCFQHVAVGLGCKGQDSLALVARAIAFQLAERIIIRAIDDNGITIGEHEMFIDYARHAIEIEGKPTLQLDPKKPVHEQISKALGKWISSLNKIWTDAGATRREIAVGFPEAMYQNPELLQRTRQLLGVAPNASDYGGYDRVLVGSLVPGKLQQTSHRSFVRGRRRS
jgi:hypothetical protein